MELEYWRGHSVTRTGPDGSPHGTWQTLLDLQDEIEQISIVTIPPQKFIGWSVHGERDEWHFAIEGKLLIAQSGSGGVATSKDDLVIVKVPALVPHGILNPTEDSATLIIASSKAHSVEEDDWLLKVYEGEIEHLINIWQDNFGPLERDEQ